MVMSAVIKKPRPKRCRVCSAPFEPRSSLAVVCSSKCAIEYYRSNQRKETKKWQREQRVKIRTRSEWLKLVQSAFNAYVRERDIKLPCISCGRFTEAKRNAGHYLSVGSHPELRFDEDNVHVQCEFCNSFKSGNAVAYRARLIHRIGLKRVERLEGPHSPAKWSVGELREMLSEYRRRHRSMVKARECAA